MAGTRASRASRFCHAEVFESRLDFRAASFVCLLQLSRRGRALFDAPRQQLTHRACLIERFSKETERP
jgi:hypothetical protein